MNIDLSVVIPILNEEDSIPLMHEKVVEAVERIFYCHYGW